MTTLEFLEFVVIFTIVTSSKHDENKIVERLEITVKIRGSKFAGQKSGKKSGPKSGQKSGQKSGLKLGQRLGQKSGLKSGQKLGQ